MTVDEGTPVFGGAIPPALMLGIDRRLLPIIALEIIATAFASMAGMLPVLVMLGVTAVTWGAAKALASIGPLLLDEVIHAMQLRWNTPGVIADDCHAQHDASWKAWRR